MIALCSLCLYAKWIEGGIHQWTKNSFQEKFQDNQYSWKDIIADLFLFNPLEFNVPLPYTSDFLLFWEGTEVGYCLEMGAESQGQRKKQNNWNLIRPGFRSRLVPWNKLWKIDARSRIIVELTSFSFQVWHCNNRTKLKELISKLILRKKLIICCLKQTTMWASITSYILLSRY